MIRCRLDFIGLQDFGQLLHLLSRKTIDDTTLAGMLTDEHDDLLVYLIGLGTYLIIQIGAIERTLELFGIHDA